MNRKRQNRARVPSHRAMLKQLNPKLGQNLLAARRRIDLTQLEVARGANIASEVYGRMERGRMFPSLPTLVRLALVLEADPGSGSCNVGPDQCPRVGPKTKGRCSKLAFSDHTEHHCLDTGERWTDEDAERHVREVLARAMKTAVEQVAGPMLDGLQECQRCGITLANYRNVMMAVAPSSCPNAGTGWEEGARIVKDGNLSCNRELYQGSNVRLCEAQNGDRR